MKNIEHIAKMIQIAEQHELLPEVILSFGMTIKEHSSLSIGDACIIALTEWDIYSN